MIFKSYEEIPKDQQDLVCEAHELDTVTDMSLQDINNFFKELALQDVVTSIDRYYKSNNGEK